MLKALLDKLRNSAPAAPFRNISSAHSYPIDLAGVTSRLRQNDFYRSREMMRADLLHMVREGWKERISIVIVKGVVLTPFSVIDHYSYSFSLINTTYYLF